MKPFRYLFFFCAMTFLSCSDAPKFDPAAIEDAGARIAHVEPLSWWTGMRTPLQLMIHGDSVSACDLRVEGPQGVRIAAVHRADSPHYLFVDVDVAGNAAPGTRYLVFSRGDETFKVPYRIDARREGSAARRSFTTADMIYLLMPDRFADGDPSIDSTPDTAEAADRSAFFGRHGGDLQGMIDHLDYIADLGATAVWSTPLLLDNEPAASYHGYACADYYRIDPRFGSNELYRDYVAACHRHGLKAIMDIVTNHCGAAHWWMRDLPFEDWVHRFPEYTQTNNLFSANMDPNASQYDLRVQESGWFDRSMPDMNLDNPFLLRYFQQWAVWWIEFADLDGLRVDTYPYNEKQPMSEWCAAVLREYPNFNIVGECWTADVPQLAYWQGGNPNRDGFDSHLPSIMDFPLRDALCAALPTDSLRWGEGMIRVYNALSDDFVYHDLSHMMIFAGNHDTERVADLVRGDVGRAKIAMTLLATLRGIPQIFAGDELLFRSADLSQGHGGLRVDFPGGWAGDRLDLFDPAQRTGAAAELFEHTRRLFDWRKTKPVIHSGRTLHFASRDNTYAYFRYDDTDAVFVFVNNSRGRKRVPWSHYAEIGGLSEGRDVLTGRPLAFGDSTLVAPRSALVVEFRRQPEK
ncbi:MAG: glycoside hydrolase family 13 protein [Alistipes sp.]|nr:glycoside hydrolase family 13 protein [Alistipes senegalensis]MCM1250115.1 glycoside hydrolase family 13 protein [Alistipes sp.]